MADKRSKKSDIPTTEVVISYSYTISEVWITRPNEVLPDEIGRVDNDGLFIMVEKKKTHPIIKNTYCARYTFATGDTIYVLRAVRFEGTYECTAKVWICAERATIEETENDILRKVTPLYEGIPLEVGSFEVGSFKDLYKLLSPNTVLVGREIYDSNGNCVGVVVLTKLRV